MKNITFISLLCLFTALSECSYKAFEKNKALIARANLATLTALSLEALKYEDACRIHKGLDAIAQEMIPTYEIIIQKGDICSAPVEAIVNAANTDLRGGAGVCGAIFAAADERKLQQACDKIIGGCPVGEARITESFDLAQKGSIKHIIHAVGPDCRIEKDCLTQDTLLAASYKNSLILADKHNISSLAFPFMSTGVYGFSKIAAADIALKTVMSYARENKTGIKTIYLVLFSQEDYDLCLQCIKNSEEEIKRKIAALTV